MLKIARLTAEDIPAAVRLSTQAGWNQLESDWRRVLDLWPQHCWAGRIDGRLVATSTLVTYGKSLGWVGFVLVDQNHRNHGYGGAMLDAALAAATASGFRTIGLDATDLGRPLYLKRGFVDFAEIDRWQCTNQTTAAPPKDVLPLEPAHWPALLALDRCAIGVDRGYLLRRLNSEPGVRACVLADKELRGFAFIRPGRLASQVGPVVADAPQSAAVLVNWLMANQLADGRSHPVILDVPLDGQLAPLLQALGFRSIRRLTRMMRPAGAAPTNASVRPWVACGLELG